MQNQFGTWRFFIRLFNHSSALNALSFLQEPNIKPRRRVLSYWLTKRCVRVTNDIIEVPGDLLTQRLQQPKRERTGVKADEERDTGSQPGQEFERWIHDRAEVAPVFSGVIQLSRGATHCTQNLILRMGKGPPDERSHGPLQKPIWHRKTAVSESSHGRGCIYWFSARHSR